MPLAYSYIRFSSKKQELGASLKRQLEMAQTYAAEHQLPLDDHSYRDLGVSARKGKNKTDGKLGMFLSALEKGSIKPGSYLLIEALDRLSREDVDNALRQFLNILHFGIKIVTLSDKQEYSTERTKQDHGMSLVQSIMYMGRANEENERKSQRVTDAKVRGRQGMDQGIIATAMAPSWLKPGPTRRTDDWILDQAKVATVRLIFDLALAGHGAPSIARQLNQRCIATMQRAPIWTFGTVAAILKNEAVIGVFRRRKSDDPPKIGYYPLIVEEIKFRLVQQSMNQRRWIAQKTLVNSNGEKIEAAANIFAGLCYCAECNSKMRAVGSSRIVGISETKQHLYVQCQTAYSGGECNARRLPYLAMEEGVVERLEKALAFQILNSSRPSNADALAALLTKKSELEIRRKRLIKLAEEVDDDEIMARLRGIKLEISEVEREIRIFVPETYEQEIIDEAISLIRQLRNQPTREVRIKIRNEISRLVREIYCRFGPEDESPTVAVKFINEKRRVEFIDLKPHLQKVGGNRRKV